MAAKKQEAQKHRTPRAAESLNRMNIHRVLLRILRLFAANPLPVSAPSGDITRLPEAAMGPNPARPQVPFPSHRAAGLFLKRAVFSLCNGASRQVGFTPCILLMN